MTEAIIGAIVVIVAAGAFVYTRFFRKPAAPLAANADPKTEDNLTKR